MKTTKTIKALETARLEIEALQTRIGSIGDYLDLGRPSPEDKAKAEAFILKNRLKVQAMEAEFKITLQTCRATQPALLERWVQTHLDTLAEIITKIENAEALDRNAKTRIYVAKTSLAEWQEVLADKRDYVSINTHFLKNYYERLSAKLPGVVFPA